MNGSNAVNGQNGGTVKLTNGAAGNLSGTLSLNSGISATNAFMNAGTIHDLTLNNSIDNIILSNTGTINGSNVINNTTNITGLIIDNKSMGTISGAINNIMGNFSIDNRAGANLKDLTMQVSNGGVAIRVENWGLMDGTNTINASVGRVIIGNNSGGNITGTINNVAGSQIINNDGATIHDLVFNNSQVNTGITNYGTLTDLTLNNIDNGKYMTIFNLGENGQGEITGDMNVNKGLLNIENSGLMDGLNLIADNVAKVTISNTKMASSATATGVISGTNTFNAQNGASIEINNLADGDISGTFNVENGAVLNNSGQVDNLIVNNKQNVFVINNTNVGELNGSLTVNNEDETKVVNLNNRSTDVLEGTLDVNKGTLNLNNYSGATISGYTQTADAAALNINNQGIISGDNSFITANDTAAINLYNQGNGTVTGNVNVNNSGYSKFSNFGSWQAALSDAISPLLVEGTCPDKNIELANTGTFSGDISVMNNIFTINNSIAATINSDRIDTRDLRLTNAGEIVSDASYVFSVQDHMNVENGGRIHGTDMAFKLTGDNVTGTLNNTGVIYSEGTTIGYDNSAIACPDCYGDGDKLTINNGGQIVAVDINNLTIPNLDSKAIDGKNIDVINQSGGLIGGSMSVHNYTQEANSTWVAFLNKDTTEMSTIFAENEISIAANSILNIHTNNDVKAFTDGQKFLLVDVKAMNHDEIETQIDNFKIVSDSPFANYKMLGEEKQGYIIFNHVAPTEFETATDLTTASHNATILGSQRIYELFVNRDVNQNEELMGMASGDSFTTTNKINFMPIGGYSSQKNKDGHAGYDSTYYGGIGYFEHDFNNSLKGGLGFAYMNNDTDFKDIDGSKGKIDSYRPFAYVDYELGDWRFDLAGGVAKHKVDNKRRYSFNDVAYLARGKYDADEISGHLNIGYKFSLDDNVVIQPIVGAYAAKLKTDTYSETGSGPMNMHIASEDYNSFKSMLGVKLSKEYELDSGTRLKPELHMRWYHEMADTKGGVSAYFLAQEQLFNTSGIELPKDVGDIAFRLTSKTGTNLDVFAEAYYQFGEKFYNAGGTIGLQYNF